MRCRPFLLHLLLRLRRVLPFTVIAIAGCALPWLADSRGPGVPTWHVLCAWCAGHPGAPAGVAVLLMGAIVPMRHHAFRAAVAAGLSLLVSEDPR